MRLHEHVGGVPIRQGEQGRLAVNKRALAPREAEKNIELVGLLLLSMRPRPPCEEVVFKVNCSSRVGSGHRRRHQGRSACAVRRRGLAVGIIPARQKAPNQNTPVDARQRIPDFCSPPTSPIPTRTIHEPTHIAPIDSSQTHTYRTFQASTGVWRFCVGNSCCWATKGS